MKSVPDGWQTSEDLLQYQHIEARSAASVSCPIGEGSERMGG
jgi:hypothetical protein